MSLTLRPYQSGAIQGIYNYFHEDTGNPLVVIPTAGGKSLVMATFVEGVLKAFPDQRILIVTHVRELIEQNYTELKKLWPQAPAGIYSAGLKQRDIHARILFAGIQSIHKRVYDVQQCEVPQRRAVTPAAGRYWQTRAFAPNTKPARIVTTGGPGVALILRSASTSPRTGGC